MKYDTKDSLLNDIVREHAVLWERLEAMDPEMWEEPGVWGDDWNVKDLVAHLAEWQRMFLTWHRVGIAGRVPDMPAKGYKWNETPRLNRDIRKKHSERSAQSDRKDFETTFKQILDLVDGLSEEQLLESGHFDWTGKNPLATYLGPNTASHYRFAKKILDRWQRSR